MTVHDRWADVRRLFEEASSRAASEREAFLLAATVDEDVRAEVRSLLEWDAGGHDFLNTPAALLFDHVAPADAPDLTDATLGPWGIVGKIGQGGMGVVYRAVRADAAFEREVGEGPLGCVVALVEEDEVGAEAVEKRLGGDRRADRERQEVQQRPTRLGVRRVDRAAPASRRRDLC